MTSTLFTNVRIIDGSGSAALCRRGPGPGQPHIAGRRRGARAGAGHRRHRDRRGGRHLMPGMTEAHVHLAWNNAATLDAIQLHAAEEHVLLTRPVARLYLDSGWTSAGRRRPAKPRLDVVIAQRDQRGAGAGAALPGGEPGDHRGRRAGRRHAAPSAVRGIQLRQGGQRTEEMRKAVRTFLKYGVDTIKLDLSGDNFVPHADARTDWMASRKSPWRCARRSCAASATPSHAGRCGSIRAGAAARLELLYHVSYTDEQPSTCSRRRSIASSSSRPSPSLVKLSRPDGAPTA